uniref:Uncharacterized protein n=1 Tax=Romanomermis culicivorax TaxID=13658 RepID=A0A915KX55_ROMCU
MEESSGFTNIWGDGPIPCLQAYSTPQRFLAKLIFQLPKSNEATYDFDGLNEEPVKILEIDLYIAKTRKEGPKVTGIQISLKELL